MLRSPPMRAPRSVRWLSRVVPGIAAAAVLCLVVLNVFTRGDEASPPPPPSVGTRIVALPSIAFDGSAATIDPGESERLDAIVETLRERPSLSVVLEGHTDALEDRPHDLARRRAEAVRRSLIERGVSADRLSVESHGSGKPVASSDTPAGRASNRRVEVIVR